VPDPVPDPGDMRALYDEVASRYAADRAVRFAEKPYVEKVLSRMPARGSLLDLGCGPAEPLAGFFVAAGCRVTGVDIAPAMLAICRERFPSMTWIEADMRTLDLMTQFDAVTAWDSFFHLPQHDQRRMFDVFARHAAPGAPLLFTSGVEDGIAMGEMYGHELFHASLDTAEYRALLRSHGFEVLLHRVEDPDCGNHTIWLAQREARAKRA
jgi:SAM-dependent methyltransferase